MSSTRRSLLLQLAAGAGALAQTPEPEFRRMPPPPATPDPALIQFLTRLRSIVEARDARALEALMLPTFRVDFDYGRGPAAFRRRWSPQSHESPVWPVLARILEIGGVHDSPALFVAPWTFARFPMDLDQLKHVVATFEDVPVLPARDVKAEPRFRVTHAILPLAAPLQVPVTVDPDSYLELAIPGHEPSFVFTNDIYSPAGYRMFFEKQAGRWRWLSLACATQAYPPDLEKLDRLGRTIKP